MNTVKPETVGKAMVSVATVAAAGVLGATLQKQVDDYATARMEAEYRKRLELCWTFRGYARPPNAPAAKSG